MAQRNLLHRIEELKKIPFQVSSDIEKVIIAEAKKVSPVVTGKFKRSWSVDITNRGGRIYYRLTNTISYGEYADTGTTREGKGTTQSKNWNGTNYSVRALSSSRKQILDIINKRLNKR